MGVKSVTGSSQVDFVDAFNQVRAAYAPIDDTPVQYRITEWRAEAGGIVGLMYYVDVEVSGRHIE